MDLPITGGCKCGIVRYECDAEPEMIFNCHCRDCQQLAGGPCTTAVLVHEDKLEVQGELTCYTSQGDNGGAGASLFLSGVRYSRNGQTRGLCRFDVDQGR
jgi:hypothetical protein